jgi:hypothetical protein
VDEGPLGQVSSEYFDFLCQLSFHSHHLSSGAGTIGQLVADVQSLTPLQETKQEMGSIPDKGRYFPLAITSGQPPKANQPRFQQVPRIKRPKRDTETTPHLVSRLRMRGNTRLLGFYYSEARNSLKIRVFWEVTP